MRCAPAREQLLALLPAQPAPWQLDLGGLDELDSAGVQLLLSLHKTLCANGHDAEVIALPGNARALLELLRLPALCPAGTSRAVRGVSMFDAEQWSQLLQGFLEEARDLLKEAEDSLLRLETRPR